MSQRALNMWSRLAKTTSFGGAQRQIQHQAPSLFFTLNYYTADEYASKSGAIPQQQQGVQSAPVYQVPRAQVPQAKIPPIQAPPVQVAPPQISPLRVSPIQIKFAPPQPGRRKSKQSNSNGKKQYRKFHTAGIGGGPDLPVIVILILSIFIEPIGTNPREDRRTNERCCVYVTARTMMQHVGFAKDAEEAKSRFWTGVDWFMREYFETDVKQHHDLQLTTDWPIPVTCKIFSTQDPDPEAAALGLPLVMGVAFVGDEVRSYVNDNYPAEQVTRTVGAILPAFKERLEAQAASRGVLFLTDTTVITAVYYDGKVFSWCALQDFEQAPMQLFRDSYLNHIFSIDNENEDKDEDEG